ncbi:MAG: 8-amino-7-oxononanoate synthase [Bacteroidota bacterium]
MKFPANEALKAALQKREVQQNRRKLSLAQDKALDFCSNDYLGFAQSQSIEQAIRSLRKAPTGQIGGTGSRLISGHSPQIAALEQQIAQIHRGEAALLFNSGYTANLGLLACIATRHDTILYDELVHASIRDGIRLSPARSFSFRHNQLDALQQKLQHAQGQVFIMVESVYSMDGDEAPLSALVELAKREGCQLIVDEAHALGVSGRYGTVQRLGLEKEVFARVFTFGKALGAHGATIVGSQLLIDYLVNFCRPFIYTTAPPPYQIDHISAAYKALIDTPAVDLLQSRIQYFRQNIPAPLKPYFLPSQTAIQSFLWPSNEALRALSDHLLDQGIWVKAILHPTVPKGRERLRISLHANHPLSAIERLIHNIAQWTSDQQINPTIANNGTWTLA